MNHEGFLKNIYIMTIIEVIIEKIKLGKAAIIFMILLHCQLYTRDNFCDSRNLFKILNVSMEKKEK